MIDMDRVAAAVQDRIVMNRFLAALAVVALLVKVAAGQAVFPSNGQVPFSQTGRALDVNMASGNWQANTLRQPRGPSGNLYVTKQVTGGFSLRIAKPYSGVNELSIRLPSEAIDVFTRDSVGLTNLIGGRSYRPQAYTSPSRAVTILAGATPPLGMNVNARSLSSRARPPKIIIPTGSLLPLQTFAPMFDPQALASLLTQPVSPDQMPLSLGLAEEALAADDGRPDVSTLFGYLDFADLERMVDGLADEVVAAEPTEELAAEPAQAEPTRDELDTVPDEDEAEPTELPGLTEDEDPLLRGFAELPKPARISGEDIFVDLLVELSQRRQSEQDQAPAPARAPEADRSLERLDVDPRLRRQDRQVSSLVAASGDPLTLRSLAGKRGDRFNRLMAGGDRHLAEGRFYQAAARYETARKVNRLNPLASIGAGLAYFGAGESFRASHYLRMALRMFPDMAKVQTDVDHLLGAEVVDKRLAEIRRRLGDNPAPGEAPLVFLMAYIHANRGDIGQARRWGEILKTLASDSHVADYADFLIGDPAPAAPVEQE